MKILKSIATVGILAVACMDFLGCSPTHPNTVGVMKQAVTATAQAYFEAGVQCALLVKAKHPEYTGKLARDEAYREWLAISTNDPYIKAP